MRTVARFYRLINHLSIDVATGAMIGALFFSSIFQTTVDVVELSVLGLTVWIIYTLDHLLDARKINAKALTARHRFHQDHFKALIFIVGIATILDIILILFIRASVLQWGMALSIMVGLYFLAQRYLFFMKEILAAVMYTAGIVLPASAGLRMPPSGPHGLALLLFMNTALINLMIFSWFDRIQDLHQQQHSFVTHTGEPKARRFILILFFLSALLILLYTAISHLWFPALILGIMNLVLLLIFSVQKYFAIADRYRLVGDAVFFLPAFYLMM